MAVDSVNNVTGRGEIRSGAVRVAPLSGNQSTEAVGPKGATERPGFSTVMKDFVGDVNAVQFKAAHAIDQMVTGEAADVHQVMVAVEEAGIALDLMLEIRNRVMDGYQELIRMQV